MAHKYNRVSRIQGKRERDGNGNGNNPRKIPDKGHHTGWTGLILQHNVIVWILLLKRSNTLIEQSRMYCYLSHQGPTLMACELMDYSCHTVGIID